MGGFKTKTPARLRKDPRIVRARKYIEQHCLNRPRPKLLAIASVAGLASPTHFHVLFSRAHRETPGAMVERLALEHARWLMADPALTLDAIAGRCGFSDGQHMAKRHRLRHGIAPSEYRRQLWRGAVAAARHDPGQVNDSFVVPAVSAAASPSPSTKPKAAPPTKAPRTPEAIRMQHRSIVERIRAVFPDLTAREADAAALREMRLCAGSATLFYADQDDIERVLVTEPKMVNSLRRDPSAANVARWTDFSGVERRSVAQMFRRAAGHGIEEARAAAGCW